MQQNLRLIPYHQALAHSFLWIPVFVLFTRSHLDLDQAILVMSVYYFFVIGVEVPSGWMSDKIGRVFTLRFAAAAGVAAHTSFLLSGGSLAWILVGQFFMATSFASLSGTDVSFHYDTLEELNIADEFQKRESRVASRGLIATTFAMLLGGALGLIDLRLAFAASLIISAMQFAVTLRLAEPPPLSVDPLDVSHLRACFSYLQQGPLAWIFLYGAAMVILVHVSFTLFQPWLTQVTGQSADDLGNTPIVAGSFMAGASLVGAYTAHRAADLGHRFGPVNVLIAMGVLSAGIVTSMAASTHSAIVLVVCLRSVQMVTSKILITGVAAPRLRRDHRATFFSLNSLAGRGSYGIVLLFVANGANDNLTGALTQLSVVAWVTVAIIAVTALPLRAPELNRYSETTKPS